MVVVARINILSGNGMCVVAECDKNEMKIPSWYKE